MKSIKFHYQIQTLCSLTPKVEEVGLEEAVTQSYFLTLLLLCIWTPAGSEVLKAFCINKQMLRPPVWVCLPCSSQLCQSRVSALFSFSQSRSGFGWWLWFL